MAMSLDVSQVYLKNGRQNSVFVDYCVCGLYRMEQIGCLGRDYRHGAGVLDIDFDSAFTLLTCGYDTIVRLWDLRASLHQWSVD